MRNLEYIVETALRAKPETRANNDVLWIEVCKALCEVKGITTLDDFFLKILYGEIPSSHSLAAAVSIVRKRCPHLRPTQEEMDLKMAKRQEYIDNYRNA